MQALIDGEPFTRVIPVNRHVRNAIAHFTYEFDASTQKITFYDKHKSKENVVASEDISRICEAVLPAPSGRHHPHRPSGQLPLSLLQKGFRRRENHARPSVRAYFYVFTHF